MTGKLNGMVREHARYESASPRNAMSVDVEEYFQVAAFERQVHKDDWGSYPSRVEWNTGRVLDTAGALSP